MDDAELESLEQGMLSLLSELGLDWVRANIEEGIAAGIHKEVPIPRGSRWKESATLFDEDGFQYDDSSPSNSGTRLIGNVRLSPSERVALISQALRRLIIELPAIHQDTIKYLAPINHDPDMAVEDVRFLPDEDDTAQPPPSLEAVMTSQARATRQAAADFLTQLDQEVTR